jgi:hypothetical protein
LTHVLLPVGLLSRRRDEAAVIWAALVSAAGGRGHRWIAVELGRPEATVLGWLRRFAAGAERVRVVFTRLLVSFDPDPPPCLPAGSVFADAIVSILACVRAVIIRRDAFVLGLSPWELACAVTDGTLLSPRLAVRTINTSSPLPINGH